MKIYYCFSKNKGLDTFIAKSLKDARTKVPNGYKLIQDFNKKDRLEFKDFMEAWGQAIEDSWAFKNWGNP